MEVAVTLTTKPCPKLTANALDDLVRGELDQLFGKANLSLVMELTQCGRPHYHGVMRVLTLPTKYPIRFLNLGLNDVSRKSNYLGFWYVKPMNDSSNWRAYCIKEIHQTKDLMKNYPVVMDNLHLFPSHFELEAETQSASSGCGGLALCPEPEAKT